MYTCRLAAEMAKPALAADLSTAVIAVWAFWDNLKNATHGHQEDGDRDHRALRNACFLLSWVTAVVPFGDLAIACHSGVAVTVLFFVFGCFPCLELASRLGVGNTLVYPDDLGGGLRGES